MKPTFLGRSIFTHESEEFEKSSVILLVLVVVDKV